MAIRNYSTKLEHIVRRLQGANYNLLNYSQQDFEALVSIFIIINQYETVKNVEEDEEKKIIVKNNPFFMSTASSDAIGAKFGVCWNGKTRESAQQQDSESFISAAR